VHSKPRVFGVDTKAVLKEAGYNDADISSLLSEGVALTEKKG
jgi:hypothetical protein